MSHTSFHGVFQRIQTYLNLLEGQFQNMTMLVAGKRILNKEWPAET